MKRYLVQALFAYVFMMSLLLTVSCTNEYGVKHNDRMQIPSLNEEIQDSGEITVARGAITGDHKLANLVGMSEDGRYWLFQSDRLKNDGNDLKPNENAALTLWDNTKQKVILNLKGIEAATYIPSIFISTGAKKIYFEGEGKIISFSGNSSNLSVKSGLMPEFDRYKVLGEIDDVLYVKTWLESNSNVSIYAIPRGKPAQELGYLKSQYVLDVCEKGFYTIEYEGKKLEKTLLYLINFAGNKQLVGDLLEADGRCLAGISKLDASVDGRYVLYSVGKTPTSLAVYDTIKKTSRILCSGDGEGSMLSIRSFWCSNRAAMAVLWDINDKEKTDVLFKKYTMSEL